MLNNCHQYFAFIHCYSTWIQCTEKGISILNYWSITLKWKTTVTTTKKSRLHFLVFFQRLTSFWYQFIEIFSNHTIYPFKICNLLVLVYPQSCAAITAINARTFSTTSNRKLLTSGQSPSTPFSHFILQKLLISFLCLGLPILDVSGKWNSIKCGLLWLASFT